MDDAKLRAWWWQTQGLDCSLAKAKPALVLARTGWARSVGGVGPYLTLFSRAGTSRAEADSALKTGDIQELPAARGCTYVLPASDFALGLRAGQPFAGAELKIAKSLGVAEREIDKLARAIVEAVGTGPLDPDGIKARVGKLVTNLGEAGKKKGLATTLPVALGWLQSEGEIRRVPLNGRLDTQRYGYTVWSPNPVATLRLSQDEVATALAAKFFGWVGPATRAEFGWFAGLGVKATAKALEPLGLVPAAPGSDRLLLPADVAAFKRVIPASKPQYALVSSLDPILANRREILTLLDPGDRNRAIFGEKGARPVSSVVDLPSHAILDRGRLIGLWEYDVESEKLVWMTFGGGGGDRALQAKVAETEVLVRDQLGDARSFSLDSPRSRAGRIAALRG